MNRLAKATLFLAAFMLTSAVHSQNAGISAFAAGCAAYSEGDWITAVIGLRRAAAYRENFTPDTYYMLISAEMYAGEYDDALSDCDIYLDSFAGSSYYPQIQYTKGKILCTTGEYDRAVLVLSDFCRNNEGHPMYPSALYYIGDALYSSYRYEEARAIFTRITAEFPDDGKAEAAAYRLRSIEQHSREEKLIYLLRQTGEEYLAAKEDYEKQLRLYNSETNFSARQKLEESRQKNTELEAQIKSLEQQIERLKQENEQQKAERNSQNAETVRMLKEKAVAAQQLLDRKLAGEKE